MKWKKALLNTITRTIILLTLVSCITINTGGKLSDPELTLEAIYLEQTVEALLAIEGGSASDGLIAADVTHEMVPGNPGSPDVEKNEINTDDTADTKTALGDSFRLGNFERPFTEGDMVYHPELDMVALLLSKGTDFYYFTLEMSAAGDDGYPSGYYGIEFDTDFDGRGDYLLWAKGTSSTDWVITDVTLLEDTNGDVGGASPVVPDTKNGDGDERVLFSADVLDDPDVAWVRLDPTNGSNIQLAVKISYIDKNRWYWKGWADTGVADVSRFDYNDNFSEAQAGSPNKSTGLYPIAALNMMDSTCWIAYNLEPTGTELGGCVQIQPPKPTDKPPCDCSGACNTYSGEFCCEYCGCTWYDSPEFKYCAN